MRHIHPSVVALAATLALAAARPAAALHEESEPAVAVTSGPPHTLPAGRAWGPVVAFASDQDLTGLGAARVPGRQVFVFNQLHYDCFRGLTKPGTTCPIPLPPYLVQATNGVGSPDNPSIGALDGSGNRWLAFDADGAFIGAASPVSYRRQVFLKNLTTGEVRMLPAARDGDNTRPTVNQLATLVVFESTAPLAGFPVHGIRQLFVYERGTAIVRQLTFGAVPSGSASINGHVIAFESAAALGTTNANTGVPQIFWSRYDPDTHTSTLSRLTAGNAPSRRPFVTETNQAVFESAATNLPGGLTVAGIKIFGSTRLDVPTPPTLSQITNPVIFGDCQYPAASPGDRLAFICTGDPLANGTVGRRLFVLDQSSSILYQLTGAGDTAGPIAASVGEWFVTAATTSDLLGTGVCGAQIWVIDYNPGFWNAATQIGQLPPDASFPVVCSDGDICNGSEVCGPTVGSCLPGTPLSCDDLNPCTTDSCHPLQGCVHTPNGLACTDLSLCTTGDTCVAGGCVATPMPCGDGDACNGTESCNPANGVCTTGPPPVCDDANPCTDDACVAASGCTFTSNTLPCDDGEVCTTGDVCQGGICSGVGPACGNSIVECGENCDDGTLNGTPGHPCTAVCGEPPPDFRIPGSRRSSECVAEWSIANGQVNVPDPRLRLPTTRQACVDGDAVCDFDPTPGRCRFHVWACFGGADVRIACPATGVASAVVNRPRITETGPAAAARQDLVAAITQLGFPLAPGEVCTRRIDVDVPAGYTRMTLATTTAALGRFDRDTLKLRCLAAP